MYEDASKYLQTNIDTSIVLLEAVLDTLESEELIKAKMALGYLYYTKNDTLAARELFKDLQDNYTLNEDQNQWVQVFFSNNKINKLEYLEFDLPENVNDKTEENIEKDQDLQENNTDDKSTEIEEKQEEETEETEEKEKEETSIINQPSSQDPGAVRK